jgi:hypothetical protein
VGKFIWVPSFKKAKKRKRSPKIMKKNRIGLLKERKIMNKKIVSPSQSQGRKI